MQIIYDDCLVFINKAQFLNFPFSSTFFICLVTERMHTNAEKAGDP